MPNATYARSQGRNRFGRRYHGRFVTKNYLKAVIGVPEAKWLDTTKAPGPVGSSLVAANYQLLNAMPQGVGQNERVGNEISNKSLHIRLDIARAAVDSLLRIIIFWNIDGAYPPSSILENQASYQSPLNKDLGKTFWVRFDRTYTIAAGQTQLVVDEIWRRFKCKTEYLENDAVSHNGLYIAYISNQTTVANQPILSYTARLNYMDV